LKNKYDDHNNDNDTKQNDTHITAVAGAEEAAGPALTAAADTPTVPDSEPP